MDPHRSLSLADTCSSHHGSNRPAPVHLLAISMFRLLTPARAAGFASYPAADTGTTSQYYFGTAVESDWTPRSSYRKAGFTSRVAHEDEILSPAMVKHTTVHDGLDPLLKVTAWFRKGWARIGSSLKSLLETGIPTVPSGM